MACLLSTTAGVSAQQYVFQAYRQPEGLKNLSVNAMATDREGFLWLATENGVFRFLGSRFERYGKEQGIAELNVVSLVADPDGSVWAGTDGNVYRWDGHNFHAACKTAIHPWNAFSLAVEDSRHLLIMSEQHLYRLEHDAAGTTFSLAPVFSNDMIAARPSLAHVISVSVLDQAISGARIWFGCGTSLCSLQDRPAGSRIRAEDVTEWERQRNLPDDYWEQVMVDHTGALWAGSINHVAVLPHGQNRFIDRSIPGTEQRSTYTHAPLIEDHQGNVLAPVTSGIARWNGSRWQIINRSNGLYITGNIAGMAFDLEGDLWFSPHGNGLYHWTGYNAWENWTEEQGLPSAVIWDIVPTSNHRLLAATDDGPATISTATGTVAPLIPHPWKYGEVVSLGVEQDGSLWISTLSGEVLHVDPLKGITQEMAKLPASILFGVRDRAGRLVIGTRDGLWERAPGKDRHHFERPNLQLPPRKTAEAACMAPNGDIWVLTPNRIFREDNGNWTEPPIDPKLKLQGGLLAISCAGDGSLWVAGELDGVWHLSPIADRLQASQLPIPSDLRSLAPLAVLADHRGWIWLGTDLGVLVWNGQQWRHLSQESGLIWNDIDQSAIVEDADGTIWIGTSGGLSHLLHPEQVFNTQPVGILLSGIEYGSQKLDVVNHLEIPWSTLPLGIQIASPTIKNRSELLFEYQMKGLNRGWIQTKEGEAIFSGLAPGEYIFSARAENPALNSVSETLQIHISIRPPWWRTWWMIGLYGLALAAILWGIYRLYARHLVARSKEMEALVSERTRELENSRAQLRIQASHDELTGMLNRKAILTALTTEMKRAVRDSIAIAVALVDLDHFKRINDVCGHMAGDEALRIFTNAVNKAIRSYDHAGRYGGEEFLLILCGIPLPEIEARMQKLQAAISNLVFKWQGREFTITCSVGVAVYDLSNHMCTMEALLSAADEALYQAKEAGRNCVIFCETIRRGVKLGFPPETQHFISAE